MNAQQIDAEYFRKLLMERKSTLVEDVETGKSAGETVKLDQTRQGRLSRMDAMQQQEMARETGRRRELELKRIEAALKRIDANEYGECLSCGNEIPPGRLEIDPAATQCVPCAEKND